MQVASEFISFSWHWPLPQSTNLHLSKIEKMKLKKEKWQILDKPKQKKATCSH